MSDKVAFVKIVQRFYLEAELHGDFVDDEVHWEMHISKEGGFTDFVWYSGISNLPATVGTWTIKKSPEDPYDWIGIEWRREASNKTWQVQYTNIHEGDENVGGFIEYGVVDDDTYDAFYDIYFGEQEALVEIDVNRASTVGRVRNPTHFRDEDWHYWDENHCDSEAPADQRVRGSRGNTSF